MVAFQQKRGITEYYEVLDAHRRLCSEEQCRVPYHQIMYAVPQIC